MPHDTPTTQALTDQLSSLTDAGQWLVAFSGGLDSTVLLHLLHRWRQEHPGAPGLSAVHVNHGLQAGADQWQAHCQSVCDRLGIELLAHRITIDIEGRGVEAAAREGRYRVFEGLVSDTDVLFMGHHLDDQVETLFLRLLRGAGLSGLTAMPASRPLGQGVLHRPLLSYTRGQLENYAAEAGLDYVEDPSNADVSMDRNFLRQQVLPVIAQRWPGYRGNIGRAIDHLAAAAQWQADQAQSLGFISDWGDPGLPVSGLLDHRGRLQESIRLWLDSLGLTMPDSAPLVEFARQLQEGDPAGHPRLATGRYVIERFRDAVYLLPFAAGEQPPDSEELLPGRPLALAGIGRLQLVPTAGPGLALEPGQGLVLRWREGGERCQPIDRAHSVALKQYLQETAVPPWWRDRLPLLYAADELVAVADLCLCRCDLFREQAPAGESNWNLAWDRKTPGVGD